MPIFQTRRKFEPAHIFHTNLKPTDKSSKVRAVTSPLFILKMISLCTFSRADFVEILWYIYIDIWLFLYELAAARLPHFLMNFKLESGLYFFQFVFRKICFLSSGITSASFWRKCTSLHWNVNYVSDWSYYYYIMFQHTCRNGVQITWFWQWAKNKLFNFIFCRTFKNIILDLISSFCTDGILIGDDDCLNFLR